MVHIKYKLDQQKMKFKELIKEIILGCQQISIPFFDKIDKELCMEIYSFLSKYQITFHISKETLQLVREILLEKYKEDQLFILNPSIQDLFEDKIYKLNLNQQIYLVPLWHNECYFDGEKGDIIVICVPDLPQNMELDEDNNIIIHTKVPFTFSLFHQNTITIKIETWCLEIPIKELYLQSFQIYRFQGKGIPKIMPNITDIHERSDILIYLHFIETI